MPVKKRKYKFFESKCCKSGEHIVRDDYSINCNKWKVNGKTYEVIGTESTGSKVTDAIDSIYELETGNVYKVNRLELWKKTRYKIISFEKC